MIEHYYECNHGLVAVVDGRTYLLTEDTIVKYGYRPRFAK